MDGIERLSVFLQGLQEDIAPEPPTEPHMTITARMVPELFDTGRVKPGDRVLDLGCGQGRAYVEVPAPNTALHHESNPNHYSVLGKSMWVSLFIKADFAVTGTIDINVTVPAGPDTYWAFFLEKKAAEG